MQKPKELYYFGTSNNGNGVAVILEREWHENILKIERISDRIINVKLACPHEESIL